MNLLRHLRNPRVLALVLLVAALLLVGLRPKSVPADLVTAERGALRVTIDEEGETRVRERFVISAPVAGRVQRIELEPGDRVKRGETVVATFLPADPVLLDARSRSEAEAAVASAVAALERGRAERARADATAAMARSEQSRAQELFRDQLVSAQVLEARETEFRSAVEALHSAEFAIAGAEHALTMARARLIQAAGKGGAIRIQAPIDGVVLRRLRESEGVVPAGTVLAELGDPQRLEIVSDLLSTDAVKVKAGDLVLIEHWGGDSALNGRVRLVEPSGFMKVSALGVEEQRVNIIVDLIDPPASWARLGDGYRVELRVVVWERPDVLRIPTSSLFRRGADWAVFTDEGGRARLKTLQVGRQNGLMAEVLVGLEAGAKVIVHPSDSVRDGVRIEERKP